MQELREMTRHREGLVERKNTSKERDKESSRNSRIQATSLRKEDKGNSEKTSH